LEQGAPFFVALLAGVQPLDGDLNNLIPQMAATYLPPFVIGLLFLMVIGALSSTADSDLSALSALVMTDVYGKNLAKGKPNPTTMLIFVGALWGTIVFPVIASLFWQRVTNKAFSSAVVAGFAMFLVTRFELLPMQGAVAVFFELCALLGGSVAVSLRSQNRFDFDTIGERVVAFQTKAR